MSNPTCETCRWWVRRSPTSGDCHRNPPVPMPVSSQGGGIRCQISFPYTEHTDFCGEHSPKPENKQ